MLGDFGTLGVGAEDIGTLGAGAVGWVGCVGASWGVLGTLGSGAGIGFGVGLVAALRRIWATWMKAFVMGEPYSKLGSGSFGFFCGCNVARRSSAACFRYVVGVTVGKGTCLGNQLRVMTSRVPLVLGT